MGLATSQARMAVLAAHKADLELEGNYVDNTRMGIANSASALFNAEAKIPAGDWGPDHALIDVRIRRLIVADEILERRSKQISEAEEAVKDELWEIQDKVTANIATSFQLVDGSSQDLTHRGYRGRRSDGLSNNPLALSPVTDASPESIENLCPPDPIIHQQGAGNSLEATQSDQSSQKLPLWRCICWHIWFCVICTTVGSCTFGIVWSVLGQSISDAFAVASYLLATGTLISGVLMFKHNEACVQRAQGKRGELQVESILLLSLNGQPD